uniref:Jupiter microtubule associated homolog 2 n=2 Tax=Erpetoichthys calabaricus TaxID=27687 RepID=A0A8C4SQP6_ERPCA
MLTGCFSCYVLSAGRRKGAGSWLVKCGGEVNQAMTSTNTFQGLDECSKPSSRVLRPPGGGSSNLFGNAEENTSTHKSNKMTSSIFAPPPEEPLSGPKRTNPPGGKDSGIFKEPESGQQQTRSQPPGGKTSNIFGESEASSVPRVHPNKPKDTGIFVGKKCEVNTEGVKPTVKPDEVQKPKQQEQAPAPAPSNKESEAQSNVDGHEPRLGPRPRSHNKVIQPPGGKSSVVFY